MRGASLGAGIARLHTCPTNWHAARIPVHVADPLTGRTHGGDETLDQGLRVCTHTAAAGAPGWPERTEQNVKRHCPMSPEALQPAGDGDGTMPALATTITASPDDWNCPVCMDLLHKPCANACGHMFCFWCGAAGQGAV